MHLLPAESEPMEMETKGENTSSFQKGKPKRKSGKKSRLLAKAKKFGKQGRLGRGFEVDTETYNYFLNVLEIAQKDAFESSDEKEAFIVNTFDQTKDKEVNLSQNQMTSRVIEILLVSATEDILLRFCTVFSPSLRIICSDPFASHVLEKLIEITSSDKWSDSTSLTEWFKQTSKYVINNFEDFVFDSYANHILRKVCQCLSGFVVPSGQHQIKANLNLPKKNAAAAVVDPSGIFGERKANKKYTVILTDFVQRFLGWPQFYDLFKVELTCGFVQALLKSFHRVEPEKVQDGIELTMKALGDKLDLEDAVAANVHTRTIEACLGLSGESQWEKIYKRFFQGRLSEFGVHEKGKFSLKKLIESCPTSKKFETIFDTLHSDLPKFYKAENYSIFVSIAEDCKKFETKQAPFLQSLVSVLGYDNEADSESKVIKKKNEPKENFIMCLARFGREFPVKEDGTPVFLTDFCGTMVLQQVMDFHKPLKVISAMLEMDEPTLSKLAQDPKGSHIVESFFQSSTIGKKDKERLFSKLREYLVTLSLSKFGARVMNVVWAWASISNKGVIAAALSERIPQLNANQYGKFLVESCQVRMYKQDPKAWAVIIEKGGKRKSEGASVDEAELGVSKKKKSKRDSELIEATDEVLKEEESEDTPKRKKKKSKRDSEVLEEIKVEEEEPVEDTPKRKKKKSRRDSEIVEAEEEAEESIVDTPKKQKKRSKRNSESTEVTEEVPVDTPSKRKKNKK